MGLDIRLPIGFLFIFVGLLLTGYGLFGPQDIYNRSLGLNVNLGWGVVLLAFGLVMMFLGRHGLSRRKP